MSPFRAYVAEYDGSTTSVARLLAESVVFLAAMATVAALLFVATA